MKKSLSLILALFLMVSLFACAKTEPSSPEAGGESGGQTASTAPAQPGGDTAPSGTDKAPSGADTEPSGGGEEPSGGESEPPVWHYALTVETTAAEHKNEDGVLLAATYYEMPRLTLEAEGDASGWEPPEEMQAVCDLFNTSIDRSALWGGTPWDVAAEAESLYEARKEYGGEFMQLAEEFRLQETHLAGDLLSVRGEGYINLGGMHPDWDYAAWNFDLTEGSFFTLSDLTDRPEELHDALVQNLIDRIYASEKWEAYYEDVEEILRGTPEFKVSFGEESMTVWFSEYEIAPFVAGIPEFEIPYAEISRFLNARGERLLALPEETKLLGDYYEAEQMWYWFEGLAPLDYDDGRILSGSPFEGYYYRFDFRGITTLDELRELLATRFSEPLVNERLSDEPDPLPFEEIDGALYVAPAGRGTDWTVGSVDYTVHLNGESGTVEARIHRLDWDEESEDWAETGEIDTVEFPFVVGENGAVFTDFACIY